MLATGSLVLSQGGVIRGLSNWGVFALPTPATRHGVRHRQGHYFAMRFDAATRTQEAVRTLLRTDPRVIRFSSVRLGDGKLETMSKIGPVSWLR